MNHYRFSSLLLAAGAALALLSTASAPARADVLSLTVGMTTGCPFGVPN